MKLLDQAQQVGRKGMELGLRQLGLAREMRQARALAAAMRPLPLPSGPRVLFLSPRDWAVHVQWEALIAQALRLRGADVRFLTCGGGLEICDRVNTYEGPPVPCATCVRYTSLALAAHGLPVSTLAGRWRDDQPGPGEWPELNHLTLPELREVEALGLSLGRLVEIPVKWFLCSSDLDNDPLAAVTYRRFLRSSRRIAEALLREFAERPPDVLVVLNGLFLFESIAATLADEMGIRVVSYERGQIDGTLFFAHGPGACRYDVDDLWPAARDRPLCASEEDRLDRYLLDRRHGRRSYVQFWPNPRFARAPDGPLSSAGRRRVVAFTNVTWDSAAQGRDAGFPSLRDWIVDVVDQLGGRADAEVVVRVHPAEVRIPGWETREPMSDVLTAVVGPLPSNVQVVGPADPLSSYSIMDAADLGVVYTSTTGLELALMGKPVIVGGKPHYAGKGFTNDARDRNEHRRLVEEVLADPRAYGADTVLARRYANLFFFDAAVAQPPAYEPLRGLARLASPTPEALGPGGHSGLDAICAGILRGSSFASR